MQNDQELYHICGDAPDPAGSSKRGAQSSIELTRTAIGHPHIVYDGPAGQRVIVADVYRTDGQLLVHILCPLCSRPGRPHALSIKQGAKRVEYDEKTDQISIERFRCTWESEPDQRRDFGLAVCSWQVVIENNVARNA